MVESALAYETTLPTTGPADAIVRVRGHPSMDAILGLIGRIPAEPWYRPGTALVLDYSACPPAQGPAPDAEGARAFARRINDAIGQHFAGSVVAIVVAGAATFGTLRMTVTYQELDAECTAPLGRDFPFRAFKSLDAALDWLGSRDDAAS